jgi:uncharacterized protein (TIGR04255 family)
MGRLYKNPPLIEANCEFQFEPSQPWDWTIPGLIYGQIKAEFPKKKQQNVLEMELRADQHVSQSVKGGISRMQFLSADEKAIIQVGPDLLALNRLRPYIKWDDFKRLIRLGLQVYREIASPKAIQRIGLRYINRLEVPPGPIEIEDYVLTVPRVPEPVPQVFATWAQRVEIPFLETNGMMVLQSGSVNADDRTVRAIILDMNLSTLSAAELTIDSCLDWVETSHGEIERTFEACITDKTRALFDQEPTNE